MVKIFIEDQKLYLERAGRKIQLSSATIYHYQSDKLYKITTFEQGTNKRVEYKQKTYPLIKIKFETKRKKSVYAHDYEKYKIYLYTQGKYYYINYYVYD